MHEANDQKQALVELIMKIEKPKSRRASSSSVESVGAADKNERLVFLVNYWDKESAGHKIDCGNTKEEVLSMWRNTYNENRGGLSEQFVGSRNDADGNHKPARAPSIRIDRPHTFNDDPDLDLWTLEQRVPKSVHKIVDSFLDDGKVWPLVVVRYSDGTPSRTEL